MYKKIKLILIFLVSLGKVFIELTFVTTYNLLRTFRFFIFYYTFFLISTTLGLNKEPPLEQLQAALTFLLLTVCIYKPKSRFYIGIGFLLFIGSFACLAYQFPMNTLSQRLMEWAFLFLTFGTVQMIIEHKFNKLTFIGIRHFLYDITHPQNISFFKNLFLLIASFCKYIFLIYIQLQIKIINVLAKQNISIPKKINHQLFRNYYLKTTTYLKKNKRTVLFRLVIFVVIIIMIHFLFVSSLVLIYRYTAMERTKSQILYLSPHITRIEPKILYTSQKVIIFGTGFKAKDSRETKLMSQHGEVSTTFWDDTKIIFTIPMGYKGEVRLWIEKPLSFEGKIIKTKSPEMTIKIIPITDQFNADDLEYQKQLKTLDKETLQINGYTE